MAYETAQKIVDQLGLKNIGPQQLAAIESLASGEDVKQPEQWRTYRLTVHHYVTALSTDAAQEVIDYHMAQWAAVTKPVIKPRWEPIIVVDDDTLEDFEWDHGAKVEPISDFLIEPEASDGE